MEMKIFHLVFIFLPIHGKLPDHEKVEFCENLECDESVDEKVCGVKYEEEDVIFKQFDNECKLLKYGCQVEDTKTYGIISMKHCTGKSTAESEKIEHVQFFNTCADCKEGGDPVCGIRPDGEGFKIRTFANECRLKRHNCGEEHEELQFTVTDFFICSNEPGLEEGDGNSKIIDEEVSPVTTKVNGSNNPIKTKNLVVVDGSMLDPRNINQSIRQFFAETHVRDLPMRDIQSMYNESTRKQMIKIFGPINVYTPWVKIPKKVSEDYDHSPTLESCFHKCPTKCPDTYAPVCGLPGTLAREPSLMFQNHCFMDVAQCKMRRESKSETAQSSAYQEASFVFCLGDELYGLYRFLPLIRTLQHMGRLKKKGRFRYKTRNMRFLNNLLGRQPKLMG